MVDCQLGLTSAEEGSDLREMLAGFDDGLEFDAGLGFLRVSAINVWYYRSACC